MLGQSRKFILTVGEENAVLTHLVRGRVRNAWIMPADPAEGAPLLAEALATDRRAGIWLLVDSFEQLYKEEPVLAANMLDQPKLVRRQMMATLPGDMLAGAYPQGQDPKTKRKFFLFCGVPRTDRLSAWIALLGPRLKASHLLPLESLGLLLTVSDMQAAQPAQGVRWRVMTTMNVTGGLRQIVSKQGRMVLTRLTPAPAEDLSPAEAAAAIERDFRQTLSYVKRLGYQPGDILDFVLVVGPNLARELKARSLDATSVLITTPSELAGALGLGAVGREDTPYSDVLHALWFATRKKPRLSLAATVNPQPDWQRQAETVSPWLAGVALAGSLWWAGDTGWTLYQTHQDIAAQQAALASAQTTLGIVQAERAALPHTAEEVRRVLALGEELKRNDFSLLPLVQGLAEAVGERALLVRAVMEAPPEASPGADARSQRGTQAAEPRQTARMSYHLPGTVTTPEEAMELSYALLDDLRRVFADSQVEMVAPPVDVLPTQTLVGGSAPDLLPDGSIPLYQVEFEISKVLQ